jgi:hypothetical protein
MRYDERLWSQTISQSIPSHGKSRKEIFNICMTKFEKKFSFLHIHKHDFASPHSSIAKTAASTPCLATLSALCGGHDAEMAALDKVKTCVEDCPAEGGDGPDVGSLVAAMQNKFKDMKKKFREIRARFESGNGSLHMHKHMLSLFQVKVANILHGILCVYNSIFACSHISFSLHSSLRHSSPLSSPRRTSHIHH